MQIPNDDLKGMLSGFGATFVRRMGGFSASTRSSTIWSQVAYSGGSGSLSTLSIPLKTDRTAAYLPNNRRLIPATSA
jgi:hypothetical protein